MPAAGPHLMVSQASEKRALAGAKRSAKKRVTERLGELAQKLALPFRRAANPLLRDQVMRAAVVIGPDGVNVLHPSVDHLGGVDIREFMPHPAGDDRRWRVDVNSHWFFLLH